MTSMGLFTAVQLDPVSRILGTGFMRFSTGFGAHGLAIWDTNSIEFLAVDSDNPGTGQFRTLIEQSKKRASRITVLHVMEPLLNTCLPRYGFTPFSRTESDGEKVTGWQWAT